ncbi:Holliday junction resolvase RuvX [Flagellatimonas centrodinii]|uniref:Holliday junction resolvase RuvX n=1 Tax=Flagellatimonas centrodinii TaxID=2806210 RepID=UPI001FF00537|nr:Holliday junction resolvase RuvX [Flagellatimonas centrodinii]ULQ46845.1 Holliday junction resolvase RuvX [Flagellatimonas centrodinii]
MAVMAFDVGEKRVGIAVGEALTGRASVLPTLPPDDWIALSRTWRDWAPTAAVVGWPLTEEGALQPATERALRFARALHGRFGCPVYACDERFSSRAADDRLREDRASGRLGRRVRKSDRDAESARVILEQWFSQGGAAGTLRLMPPASGTANLGDNAAP